MKPEAGGCFGEFIFLCLTEEDATGPKTSESANARSRGLHNPSPTSRTPLPLGHERERGCTDLNYCNGVFVYLLQSDLKFKLSQLGKHVPRTSSDVNTWSYLPHIYSYY